MTRQEEVRRFAEDLVVLWADCVDTDIWMPGEVIDLIHGIEADILNGDDLSDYYAILDEAAGYGREHPEYYWLDEATRLKYWLDELTREEK